MEKEFIPYEQALALKELGFDEPCFRGWYEDEGLYYHPDSDIVLDNPTFSQAFRWFREKYKPEELNFYIHLLNTYSTPKNYLHCYTIRRGVSVIEVATRDTYEEAELACLDKLIEIVESKLK
jgi:hypothetical protein